MANLSEVFKQYDTVLENLANKAEKLVDIAEIVNNIEDEIERNSFVEKQAFILTLNQMQSELPNILTAGILESCIRSKEFNYPPFISHLTDVALKNIDDILTFEPGSDPDKINIEVKFDILGTADEWAEIAKSVRAEHGWGKSRGAQYEGEDLASRKWREIYQVDREGKKVTKKHITKNKKTGKTTVKVIDMTERLRGKYTDTIKERLSLIPNKAPYWYIIEHGNSVQFGGGSGVPYPEVAPVNMSSIIENKLQNIFDKTVQTYKDKAEELFLEDFYKDLGIKRKAKSFKYLPEDLRERTEELLSSKEGVTLVPTKVGQTIQGTNDAYRYITNRGTIVTIPRVGGKFGRIAK